MTAYAYCHDPDGTLLVAPAPAGVYRLAAVLGLPRPPRVREEEDSYFALGRPVYRLRGDGGLSYDPGPWDDTPEEQREHALDVLARLHDMEVRP